MNRPSDTLSVAPRSVSKIANLPFVAHIGSWSRNRYLPGGDTEAIHRPMAHSKAVHGEVHSLPPAFPGHGERCWCQLVSQPPFSATSPINLQLGTSNSNRPPYLHTGIVAFFANTSPGPSYGSPVRGNQPVMLVCLVSDCFFFSTTQALRSIRNPPTINPALIRTRD